MKLITKLLEKKLPRLREAENQADPMIIIKLFGGSSFTWYLTEYDPDTKMAFGYVDLGDHDNAALGYFSIAELESLRFPPFGLGVERDLWFDPKPLSQIIYKNDDILNELEERVASANKVADHNDISR
ncbi:MAG: DUF2958 domain-containing protein [Sulfuricurvum sp.]|nr:DUF2958 domain-containing protein [Sulfuricurvum sp.]